MKNEVEKFDRIWKEARESAESAAADHSGEFECCGFSWILVSGRGNFGKYAKEVIGAYKNYGGAGLNIWYSKVYSARTQNMQTHISACSAAAEVLRKNGIDARVHSRMD